MFAKCSKRTSGTSQNGPLTRKRASTKVLPEPLPLFPVRLLDQLLSKAGAKLVGQLDCGQLPGPARKPKHQFELARRRRGERRGDGETPQAVLRMNENLPDISQPAGLQA